jgi:predicted nucleic acid-binding protein
VIRGDRYVYLDASALVKLVVREPEWQALRLYLGLFPLRATSILSMVEVPRAVARHLRRFEPRSMAIFRGLEILPFDRPLASAAVHLPPMELRSLDAVHLASAVALAPDLESVVTYDARLAEAAELAGIPVVEPR